MSSPGDDPAGYASAAWVPVHLLAYFGFVAIARSLLFSIGYILLGVAAARTGVLPRAAGLLLAVGAPILAFSPPIGIRVVAIVGYLLFGSGLIWLGRWFASASPNLPPPPAVTRM